MTKTLRVEGLMCPRCDARVKKALEEIEGVLSAEANHETGLALVVCESTVSDDVIISAIENQGYAVLR